MAYADRNKEERFLRQHRDETANNLKWASLLGAAIMIGFMWQDTLISTVGYKAINIRLFGALPVSALAWYLSRNLVSRRFISYISAFFWLSYACFTIAIFIIYEPGPYGLTSSAGLGSFLLILFGIFAFSNLRFWASLLVGLLILLAYAVSVALWTKVVFIDFIMGDLLTAVALFIGAATKTLFTDRARRRQFETSEQLSESYATVEQQVQERTAELTGEITLRKQADMELQNSEKKYRSLVENINDMIYTLDSFGRFTYVSPIIEKFSSYKAGDLIGKDFADFVYPDDLPGLIDSFNLTVQGEQTPYEYRILDGDKIRYVRSSSQLILKDGVVTGLTGVLTDITDRKHIEEKLQKSETNLKEAQALTHMGSWEFNIANQEHFWSDEMCSIYEFDPESGEPTFEHLLAKIHPDDRERINISFKQALAEQKPLHEEYRIFLSNDNEKLIEASGYPIFDDSGNLIRYSGTSQDITKRKQAEEKLYQTLDRLKNAVSATFQVMVSAIEMRDPYTAGHQIRVANIASAIATEMGLSQDRIEGIRLAGSIHDIGKLSIPAEILSKPTKLSELEFSLIKTHARQGYEMLKNVESPWPLAEIVYQHHEQIDGSGYPRKLKGNDILIEARILNLADVVESMASHRPYRPAKGIKEALEEIEKNSGILYDEAVTDACLRLFREKGYHLELT